MKNKQTKSPIRLYQTVAVLALLSYVVGCAQSIYWLFKVYGTQVQPSQFTYVMILGALLPLVFFAATWWAVRGERWYRLYVTSLITTAAVAITWALKSITYLTFPFFWVPGNFEMWMVIAEIIPVLIAAGLFIFVIRMLRKQKKIDEKSIRKFFVGGIAILILTNIVQEMYFIIQQYPDNQNLSGFTSFFVSLAVIAVVAIPIYVLEKKRTLFDRLFVTSLLVVMLFFLISSVTSIDTFIPGFVSTQTPIVISIVYTVAILGFVSFYIYLCKLVRRLV